MMFPRLTASDMAVVHRANMAKSNQKGCRTRQGSDKVSHPATVHGGSDALQPIVTSPLSVIASAPDGTVLILR